MPTSIFTTLILWSSLLDPSSGIGPASAAEVDRPACLAFECPPTASIWSWPDSTPGSWDVLDADLEEEETGDGDPEGLAAAETVWISPRLLFEASASPIRRDLALILRPTRSKILRC